MFHSLESNYHYLVMSNWDVKQIWWEKNDPLTVCLWERQPERAPGWPTRAVELVLHRCSIIGFGTTTREAYRDACEQMRHALQAAKPHS